MIAARGSGGQVRGVSGVEGGQRRWRVAVRFQGERGNQVVWRAACEYSFSVEVSSNATDVTNGVEALTDKL